MAKSTKRNTWKEWKVRKEIRRRKLQKTKRQQFDVKVWEINLEKAFGDCAKLIVSYKFYQRTLIYFAKFEIIIIRECLKN